MTQDYKAFANQLKEKVLASRRVLLHLHPSPDGDSVGSVLAMKEAVEALGKEADIIAGDSGAPPFLMHLPGAERILNKNFFEIDLNDYDLFIVQDAANEGHISKRGPIVFPPTLTVAVIDHHDTNKGYGALNLVDATVPATAQLIYEVITLWGISLTPSLATNLLVGIHMDTGGFRYLKTNARSFQIAAELYPYIEGFSDVMSRIENSDSPDDLRFLGFALSRVEVFGDSAAALSCIGIDDLKKLGIDPASVATSFVTFQLRSVPQWKVVGCLVEKEEQRIKVSLRTSYDREYNLSPVITRLGGGGHPGAAGAQLNMSLTEAKQTVLTALRESYPNLNL